jgi:membrane protein implicated in regulation of membrane protease activity
MFKLIKKRGVIQNHVKTKSPTVDFRINTLDVECRWQHKCEDLEKDDEIIVVGYMGYEEYNDTILYVCAYFNLSKNKSSSTKQTALYWLGGLIAVILPILFISSKAIKDEYMLAVLIFLFVAFISFFLVHNLIAYRILEKEIKKLHNKK